MEKWRRGYYVHGDMDMRLGYEDMDMDTWTWRHGHGGMYMET
jgi:hypothetical protein